MINLDETDSVAILGNRDTGKTNLAFYFMNTYKGEKKKYLYGYPKEVDGYTMINHWLDVFKITDSIVFIDELQRYIRFYETKSNFELMEFISFLKHNNVTLIFTTHLSQFITKGIEASIQTWCIKQLDIGGLKNGCKAKRILKNTSDPRITQWSVKLDKNEFVAYDEMMPVGFNGIKKFDFQGIGKDWKADFPINSEK